MYEVVEQRRVDGRSELRVGVRLQLWGDERRGRAGCRVAGRCDQVVQRSIQSHRRVLSRGSRGQEGKSEEQLHFVNLAPLTHSRVWSSRTRSSSKGSCSRRSARHSKAMPADTFASPNQVPLLLRGEPTLRSWTDPGQTRRLALVRVQSKLAHPRLDLGPARLHLGVEETAHPRH